MRDIIIILVVGFFLLKAHESYEKKHPNISNSLSSASQEVNESAQINKLFSEKSGYKCDGRTHCSQMTSCAEATFFLKNCPGVEMDGNNDGEPCERQWCN